MSELIPHLASIVLAGGESRRMGRPKCWLPAGQETFLQRIVRTVSAVAPEVIVVAAADQELPPLPRTVAVIRDLQPAGGPLVGLLSGSRQLQSDPAYVFVSGCDTPFLRREFIARVVAGCEGYEAAVPVSARRRHPLAACYSAGSLRLLEDLIIAQEQRLQAWLNRLKVQELHACDFSTVDPELESLINLNTPEDWASWKDRLTDA